MDNIDIYLLDGCPFCKKVRDCLDELDLPYSVTKVPPSHDHRDKLKEISGQTSAPVISDPNNGIEAMNQSDDIVEYLRDEYGESEDN